jgi:hypothetical protein
MRVHDVASGVIAEEGDDMGRPPASAALALVDARARCVSSQCQCHAGRSAPMSHLAARLPAAVLLSIRPITAVWVQGVGGARPPTTQTSPKRPSRTVRNGSPPRSAKRPIPHKPNNAHYQYSDRGQHEEIMEVGDHGGAL